MIPSKEMIQLPNGLTVRLGRIRPKAKPPALMFKAYFAETLMTTPPPSVVDYGTKAAASIERMYLNDQYGDCVIAGKMHQLGIWSGNDGQPVVQATDSEVLQQYHEICGPGDNGCMITNVLDVGRSKGWRAGGKTYKIDGYVSVDNTNKLEVQVALYLFGSLTLGIDLPAAWANAPDGGRWDTTNTQIVGGHDVCAIGYDEAGVWIATWGGKRLVMWPAFQSKKWITELYAELAPLWYGSDKLAPCGVDAAALQADLAKLGGGVIPDIGPPVPPTPPVPSGNTVTLPLAIILPAGVYEVSQYQPNPPPVA